MEVRTIIQLEVPAHVPEDTVVSVALRRDARGILLPVVDHPDDVKVSVKVR